MRIRRLVHCIVLAVSISLIVFGCNTSRDKDRIIIPGTSTGTSTGTITGTHTGTGTETGTGTDTATGTGTLNPPGQAYNPVPGNGATDIPVTQSLSWSADGADTYTVYHGTSPAPPLAASGLTTASYSPGNHIFDATYYWRVDTVNPAGTTEGLVWRYSTETQPSYPPAKASNPNPADNAVNVSVEVTMSWSAAKGATYYDVCFGNSSPPPLECSGITVTSYYPGSLEWDTTYYWQINAGNDAGTTEGDLWTFRTAPLPPGKATNPSPPDDAEDMSTCRILEWSAAPRAITYNVYLDKSTPPVNLVAKGIGETFHDPGYLDYSTEYFWQVESVSEAGATRKSDIWSFRTAPDFRPELISTYTYPPGIKCTYDLRVFGDIAYGAAGVDGVTCLDLSNRMNVSCLNTCGTLGTPYGIDVQGDYAYVATGMGLFSVIRISGDDMQEVGTYSAGLSPFGVDVTVSGNYAYVADTMTGLLCLDVSDPTDPTFVFHNKGSRGVVDVFIENNIAYIAGGSSKMIMLDITDPTSYAFLGRFDNCNYVYEVVVQDNRAYIAAGQTLEIVDVSDPTNPFRISQFSVPPTQELRNLFIRGDFIYTVDTKEGLLILDVYQLPIGKPAGALTGICAGDIRVVGDYIYVGAG